MAIALTRYIQFTSLTTLLESFINYIDKAQSTIDATITLYNQRTIFSRRPFSYLRASTIYNSRLATRAIQIQYLNLRFNTTPSSLAYSVSLIYLSLPRRGLLSSSRFTFRIKQISIVVSEANIALLVVFYTSIYEIISSYNVSILS